MAERSQLERGFVLTRHWRDTPEGIVIDFWLATDHGPQKIRLPPQEAVAFIPAEFSEKALPHVNAAAGCSLRPLALRDFHRRPVVGIYCQR